MESAPVTPRLVSVVRFTSLATLASILFGLGTNKIVASLTGQDGVALVGLYRTISALTVAAVSFGVGEVILQRVSASRDRAETSRILAAVLVLLIAQSAAIITAAFVLSGPIAALVFGREGAADYRLPIGLTIALSIGIVFMQVGIAILGGLMRVREASLVSLITSAVTLASAYPLVRSGSLGLTVLIGGTCFAGAAAAGIFIFRSNPLTMPPRDDLEQDVRSLLPLRSGLPLHPIALAATALTVQGLIQRNFDLSELGTYNAAVTIQSAAVMLLTSSMRSFYLPMLARLPEGQQRAFANSLLRLLLVPLVGGSTILLFGSDTLLTALFSSAFVGGGKLLGPFCVSMVGELWTWLGAMLLLQRRAFGTFVVLELSALAFRAVLSVACVASGLGIVWIARSYAATFLLLGFAYVLVTSKRTGWKLAEARSLVWSAVALGLLVLGTIASNGSTLGKLATLSLIAALLGLSARVALREARLY